MKTTKIFALSAIALVSLGATSVVGTKNALAVDGGDWTSNGIVTFEVSKDPTSPVDPSTPTNPITPIDPINPGNPIPDGTAGPLSIDFASSFNFGKQKITSTTQTYSAVAQEYTDTEKNQKFGPNFVQVTDNRGTEKGWTLLVKQDAQFTSSKDKKILDGAQVYLTNGNVVTASDSAKPTAALPDPTANGLLAVPIDEYETIMSATDGQGAGTFLLAWGKDATEGASSVKLEVPGSTTKYADSYSTTFNWMLTDAPGN